MLFDDHCVEDEDLDPTKLWSVIRYLDPDEKSTDAVVDTVTVVALFALVIIVCSLCGLFWLKVR
jgi:hypothetical protein